jgi:hypothetical protein
MIEGMNVTGNVFFKAKSTHFRRELANLMPPGKDLAPPGRSGMPSGSAATAKIQSLHEIKIRRGSGTAVYEGEILSCRTFFRARFFSLLSPFREKGRLPCIKKATTGGLEVVNSATKKEQSVSGGWVTGGSYPVSAMRLCSGTAMASA